CDELVTPKPGPCDQIVEGGESFFCSRGVQCAGDASLALGSSFMRTDIAKHRPSVGAFQHRFVVTTTFGTAFLTSRGAPPPRAGTAFMLLTLEHRLSRSGEGRPSNCTPDLLAQTAHIPQPQSDCAVTFDRAIPVGNLDIDGMKANPSALGVLDERRR